MQANSKKRSVNIFAGGSFKLAKPRILQALVVKLRNYNTGSARATHEKNRTILVFVGQGCDSVDAKYCAVSVYDKI